MLISVTIIAFLMACLLVAAISDLLTMTIPNSLNLALVLGFLIAAVLTGMDASQLGWHILAGGLVLLISFVLFALGWIGGGDAKLAAAIALWIGFSDTLLAWLVITSLFGGALTLVLLYARRWPLPAVLARQEWALHLHQPKTGIPYGIALAAGGLWILPMTHWFRALPL